MTRSEAVLITGCSTGIGRATATLLARRGRTVYATARKLDALDGLAEQGCHPLALDVTDEESMRAAVDHVVQAEGAVGVLVNNAGYSLSGALETLPPSELRRQFETNVFGLLRMCQLALPGMRAQRWGRIVNISSMGANFTFPGGGAYHATKYAVEALSDALRFEVEGFGVEVCIVQPGLIRTEFSSTAAATATATTATTATTAGSTAAGAAGEGDGAGDPYGRFNAGVARSTREVYVKGPLAMLGGGPEAVAEAVAGAIDKPRIRIRVTPSAHVLIALRRLMTDRMWDRFLTTQFTRPGSA